MKLFGLAAVFIMCTLIAASSGQAEESFSELGFIYDPFFPSLGGTAVMEDAHQKLIARFGTPTKQEKWSNVPRDPTVRVLQEKWLYGD